MQIIRQKNTAFDSCSKMLDVCYISKVSTLQIEQDSIEKQLTFIAWNHEGRKLCL